MKTRNTRISTPLPLRRQKSKNPCSNTGTHRAFTSSLFSSSYLYLAHLHRRKRSFMTLRSDTCAAWRINNYCHFRQKCLYKQCIGYDTYISTEADHLYFFYGFSLIKVFKAEAQLLGAECRLVYYKWIGIYRKLRGYRPALTSLYAIKLRRIIPAELI